MRKLVVYSAELYLPMQTVGYIQACIVASLLAKLGTFHPAHYLAMPLKATTEFGFLYNLFDALPVRDEDWYQSIQFHLWMC